ncbi:MAG: alpha/beta hydrolase [Acidimicrobiaceae bacterium]|nr:alpha/beta hydrolase [Acidimicrobiaceae bacterium]
MDRATSFKRAAKHLSGYEVISYDRRGYATSPFQDINGMPKKVSWQIHLRDLTEIVNEKPTVVFGHSYGGTLTLLAAERRVENLLGLVAFESPLSWIPGWSTWSTNSADPSEAIDLEWAKKQAKGFMISMIGEDSWRRLPPSTKRSREIEGITMLSEMSSMSHLSPVLDPSQIKVPVIIARSEQAPERHVKGSDYLANTIPDSQIRIVSNTDHGVHLKRPETVAELVREIIARL